MGRCRWVEVSVAAVIVLAAGSIGAAAEPQGRARPAPAPATASAPPATTSSMLQEIEPTRGFVEETWLATIREDGARHGLAHLAGRIFRTTSGLYYSPDDEDRAELLALRRDATVTTRLAPDYERRGALLLKERLGRTPSAPELRIGAYLGPSAGARLIEMASRLPNKRAAGELPDIARAHQRLFYDCERECTLADVYRKLSGFPPPEAPSPPQATPRKQAGWSTVVVSRASARPAIPRTAVALRGGLPGGSQGAAPAVAMGLGAKR